MKPPIRWWIVLTCLMLTWPAHSLQDGGVQAQLAEMVRQMGYGGGIHNFKNYVLRGRPEYQTDAHANFTRTLQIIARLERRADLDAAERQGLAAVKSVVESYDAAIELVAELRKKGWRIEDIDRAVITNDAAAIDGLDTLRAKWTWSELQEAEYQLGYGKAIHNFKDYVLRGQEQYHTAALEHFLAAEALLASQLGQREFSMPQAAAQALAADRGWIDRGDAALREKTVEEIALLFSNDRAALQNVERTAHAYREHLGLIERLIALQRTVRQIDLAVKINDGPAKAALRHLQGRDARLADRLSQP